MRLSKWRGGLLTLITLYASSALAQSILRFDTGPFESLPPVIRLVFWPTSPLAGLSNTLSLSSWLSWFWCLESVLASLLLWALLTWPVELYLKKRGWHRHAGYIEHLASWWELALLIGIAGAMGGASYYVLQHYPSK